MTKQEMKNIGRLRELLTDIHFYRNEAKRALDLRESDDFDNAMSNVAIAAEKMSKIRRGK